MRLTFAVASPALFFVACLAEPKTACRTIDDCAPGRVCVAGTCQPGRRDAGLDAGSDRQSLADTAIDSSEGLTPDLAGAPDGVPDLAPPAVDVAPDAPVAINAPGSPAGPDASSEIQPSWDVAIDLQETPSPDLASDRNAVPDLASPLLDAAADAPTVPTIDASPALDVPQSGVDVGSADCNGDGNLPPAPVSWEDFLARSPRETWTGGRYIVDGDLAFDEAGLRGYYDAWFAAAGVPPENLAPMGATNSWPFPDSFFLSYCIGTDFGDNLAAVETAMQAAASSWSDRVGVQYTYVPEENASCNADNPNVTFDVRPVTGAGYAAVSFFPDAPRSARSLLVNTPAVGAGGVALEAILRHQLGHALGFQHEHLWLDPACTSEDSGLAVQIANYDIDSVMHLPTCRPSEQGGTMQTERDFAGATTIYGLSPALVAVIEM